MSAQAGIFYFDGRPLAPDLVERLDAPLQVFGPDGRGQFAARGLLMVHRALHVTPEDRHERQPFVSRRGNVMTWDGRLDNRDDLRIQLWRELASDTTDVAIAMAAFERWGVEAFPRLIGDWSLAVFDRADSAVLLASDYMGVRPMYYCATRDSLMWSSSLAGLVTFTRRREELDERFIFGALVGVGEPDLTPYREISALSPAHFLIQRPSGECAKRCYWQCGHATIEHPREAGSVDQLRQVLVRAVADRLRASRPVWCEVSGGLDSSAVACLAHTIVSCGGASAALRFVSYVNDASPESDERRFAEEAERHCGVPTEYIPFEAHPGMGMDHWLAPVPRSPIETEVARRMDEHGDRVILTGRVGDAVMGNTANDCGSLSDLLAVGRLARCFSLGREWSRASHEPLAIILSRALWRVVEPLVGGGSDHAALVAARRDYIGGATPAHSFSLNARFATEQMARLAGQVAPGRIYRYSRAILKDVDAYAAPRRLQSPWWIPTQRWSHPFADRRLVEFVAAIPFHTLCPPGRPRGLMKQALTDVLPPRIRDRFSKGYAAPHLNRSLRPVASALLRRLDRLKVVERGFVDPILLSTRLKALLAGSSTSSANLLQIAIVERWLQAHARNRESRDDCETSFADWQQPASHAISRHGSDAVA